MSEEVPPWRFDADYLYGNMVYHYDQLHYAMAAEHATWLLELLKDETRDHEVEVNRDLMSSDPIQLVMAEAAAHHVINWFHDARDAHLEELGYGPAENLE